MGPRHRVIGYTREQAPQFDRRGEFAVLRETARIVLATASATRNMGRRMQGHGHPGKPRFDDARGGAPALRPVEVGEKRAHWPLWLAGSPIRLRLRFLRSVIPRDAV